MWENGDRIKHCVRCSSQHGTCGEAKTEYLKKVKEQFLVEESQ